ncbi:MAG TPA: TonB family protein [Opitutaceae bacterium]|nr:TonB family protein [Opitutaceae bacterium]
MNKELILPAAFALTVHAFVLFGMPGRRPAAPPAPDLQMPPLDKLLPIDNDELRRDPDAEERTEVKRGAEIAPREYDVPRPVSTKTDFVIVTLPPIRGNPDAKTIPVDWTTPREGTGTSSRPVDWRFLDHVPRARLQPAPVYPADLRKLRAEGTVCVEFVVDEAGNVFQATVVSATRPGFEEAALRAVVKWKFEPGLKDGCRVRFRMSVPLVFRMADD